MFILSGGTGFSINNLLAGLISIEPAFQEANQDPFQQKKVVQCENCSMTFQQFIKVGKFGCAHCYEAFQEQLEPMLQRLHSGNLGHSGKIPARIGGSIHLRKNIENLKHTLKELVSQEEFEKAAEIRDEIRMLEKELIANQEGGE